MHPSTAPTIEERFGFLFSDWTLQFDGIKVAPLPEHLLAVTEVRQRMNPDRFIYPPIVVTRTTDLVTNETKEVPNTRRPAFTWPITPPGAGGLPASHALSCPSPAAGVEPRLGPPAFILNLLGYLFGVRLQYEGWPVDGRVLVEGGHNIHFTQATAEDFLSRSYQRWSSWSRLDQTDFVTLLFMHSRVPGYEWEWERFAFEYTVFDGIYALAARQNPLLPPFKAHGKRIPRLCALYGIPVEKRLVEFIVTLRNDLFHQVKWDGSQPGSGGSNAAFIAADHLRRLNQRLFPALLGYNTPYLETHWWTLGTSAFDPPP